jgi:hypothetical protein
MRHTKVIAAILLVMIVVNAIVAIAGGQSVDQLAAQNPAAASSDFKSLNTIAGRPSSDHAIVAVGAHTLAGPGTHQTKRLPPKVSQAMNVD